MCQETESLCSHKQWTKPSPVWLSLSYHVSLTTRNVWVSFQWTSFHFSETSGENWTDRLNHAHERKPLLICLHEADTYRENTLHLQTISMTSVVAWTVTVSTEIRPRTTYQARCKGENKKIKERRRPIPCHFLKINSISSGTIVMYWNFMAHKGRQSLSQGISELLGLKSISEPIKSHLSCSKTVPYHEGNEKTVHVQKQHGHVCTVRLSILGH